jgi:hypothetical protein
MAGMALVRAATGALPSHSSHELAMLPRPRLFVKKRGTRRTGAPWVGMVAEGFVSAGLLTVGSLGLYWLIDHVANVADAGRWPWFAMLIPIALIVYGAIALGGVLWQSAASTERRAAVVQMATDWELPGADARPARPVLPTVPPIDAVIDSAGVRLAYRLPIDAAPGWVSFTMAAVCLTWNTLVAVFVLKVISLHREGHPNWLLTWLMLPFVLAGVWTLVALVRQVLLNTAIGATLIEVSQHPFYPGGTFHGFMSQTGRLRVRWLQVQLVCEEQAIYQQGTDTRRATSRVYRAVLLSQRKFEIEPQRAFEASFDLTLPDSAMHSFASPHNAVMWSLVVCGRLTRWGSFERRFPIYVYPLRVTASPPNAPLTMARA